MELHCNTIIFAGTQQSPKNNPVTKIFETSKSTLQCQCYPWPGLTLKLRPREQVGYIKFYFCSGFLKSALQFSLHSPIHIHIMHTQTVEATMHGKAPICTSGAVMVLVSCSMTPQHSLADLVNDLDLF